MAGEETGKEVEHEMARPEDMAEAKVTEEYRRKAQLVADLLTIKVNDLHPWYETKYGKAVSTTLETLRSRYMDTGWILVLTHVSAGNSLHTTTTTEIGIERGGEFVTLNRDVPSAADITVDWDGQVILIDRDRVAVKYRGCTANDIMTVSMSGYRIKA